MQRCRLPRQRVCEKQRIRRRGDLQRAIEKNLRYRRLSRGKKELRALLKQRYVIRSRREWAKQLKCALAVLPGLVRVVKVFIGLGEKIVNGSGQLRFAKLREPRQCSLVMRKCVLGAADRHLTQ